MAIYVYNTLTRKKEKLIPRSGKKVGIYVCGITPYSKSHIGHARPSIFWDVVRKYLEYKGYTVTLVQNFTDVDDKIINTSQKDNVDPLELAGKYADDYIKSMDALGVARADYYPRASEHMDDIVEMISVLINKGYAYESGGDVYFDVSAFDGYGKLSRRTVEEMKAGARVEISDKKTDPMDFALWKTAKPGEPFWQSPWGRGRPGWHIECSAMSLKYLKNGFEIHGGGTELVFPHHENEIAQSEAYTGEQPFVKYWIHNELLNFSGEKMSKSIGNIVTIDDLLERYAPESIRLFMLSAHYRSPLEFDEDLLRSTVRGWKRLTESFKTLESAINSYRTTFGSDTIQENVQDLFSAGVSEYRRDLLEKTVDCKNTFEAAMNDDFNTAQATGSLFDLSKTINHGVYELGLGTKTGDGRLLQLMYDTMLTIGGILGVIRRTSGVQPGIGEVNDLIGLVLEIREDIRKKKDWVLSDKIRDGLLKLGYKIEDTPNGPRWKRL